MPMLTLDKIPKAEHENVMTSFWTMVRECERTAIDNKDPVLKHCGTVGAAVEPHHW